VSKTAASTAPAKAAVAKKAAAPSTNGSDDHVDVPAPKGTTKDGIAYTKDFDAKFLKAQRDLLVAERVALVGQADRLEDEANSLIEDGEMGDVQFDDESGEGDTMVVERERDLALSAQARQTVSDIDAALERLADGTYGYSLISGKPIPRERLEAIPWATELVEEKVGGIGRR
jgi:RNA polymerase-binding transcription factor DksA